VTSRSQPLHRRALWTAKVTARAPLEARFPFRSPEAIERAQRRRLRATVAHAYEHVPYYRETMRERGLTPADITRAEDIARLPLIERDQLQRDPEYFVSGAWPSDAYLRLRSGGSSGQPITVQWDPLALFEVGAYQERFRSLLTRLSGRRLRYREARIVSPIDASRATGSAFASLSLLPQALRAGRMTLSLLDPPEVNIPRLNAFQPEVIGTYGSYLEALFTYLRTTDTPFHRPKVAVHGGDPLSARIRELISELGIEVLSVYNSIEAFSIGFECEQHVGFHLNSDLVPIRVVDAEGSDAATEESGEVVISNLVNRGTVLLNYRLGDVAARLDGRCPCGRSLPMLSFLEGRSDEWILSTSGRRLHHLTVRAPLSDEPGVWRYQVIQLGPGRLRVEIVPAPDADREGLRSRLARDLAARLGAGGDVEVAYVGSLPTSALGKVRAVMSLETRRRLELEVATSGAGERDPGSRQGGA
jgi:phenylacetate-CoA ligase